jgi:hypothetical protein
MNDTFQSKMAMALGVPEGTPETVLVSVVLDLVAFRERVEAGSRLEQRVSELQNACHCARDEAMRIITAQKAGA